MKKKLFSVVLIITLVASLLAGCKTKDNNSSSTSDTKTDVSQTEKTEEKEPEPPKPITISLGLPGGYDVTNEEIIKGFQDAYPHITLDIDEAPWGDFTKKIMTQIAGGNAPDVWFQENAAVIGYGAKGAAEDLKPFIDRDLNIDEYVVSTLLSAEVNGKVFGVPHGGNPIALAYNKKLFDEANVPYPTDDWTYEDMIEAAKLLTRDTDGDGKTDVWGFLVGGGITDGWFPWIKSAGGQALDETKTQAVFNDEKSLKGITEWVNMIHTYKVSPTLSAMREMQGARQMFGNGLGAMMFLQYSLGETVLNKNYPDLDYDTVKIPLGFDGGRTVPNVGNTWLIFSKAKPENKEAAWTFLKYYLSADVQKTVASSGSTIPVNKEALTYVESLSFKPLNKKAYTEGIAEGGVTLDENKCWNEWRTAAQPIFNEILEAKVDPAEGLDYIQKEVQKVLDEHYK